ncbi:MAG: helix-turn-helix transcriptional regulator [Desulfobacterales bacterium]
MADDKVWRENLRRIRKMRGLTLDQLERLTGISKAQLSMLENGKRPFTQKVLSAILDELGFDFSDIFCGCAFHKRKGDSDDFDQRRIRPNHPRIIPIRTRRSRQAS